MKARLSKLVLNLNSQNWWKILKGAGLAAAGLFIAYLIDNLGSFDFGEHTLLIAGVISVLLNYARKVIEETKIKEKANDS